MKFKKIILSLTLFVLVISPTAALASAYAYNFDFKYKLNSQLFSLYPKSPNYLLTMENTSSTYGNAGTSAFYYVDLYRDNGWGVGEFISTRQFYRNGTTKREWTISDGKGGKYGFTMRKGDDGQYVRGHGSIWDY